MKRSTISILMTAGLLAVLLSGCRLGGGTEGEAAALERERMFPSQRPVRPRNRCRNQR